MKEMNEKSLEAIFSGYPDNTKNITRDWKMLDEEYFKKEYHGEPVGASDSLRLNEMHQVLLRLEDKIRADALAKEALIAENINLKTTNKELIEENIDLKTTNKELIEKNKELSIEVEKIRSRFDILDL